MRRTPEGTPPVPTDYAPHNQADGPGKQQARPGTENRADVIRARTRRSKGKDNQNRRYSQQSLAHGSSPVRLNVKSNTRAPSAQCGKHVGNFFQWIVAEEPQCGDKISWNAAAVRMGISAIERQQHFPPPPPPAGSFLNHIIEIAAAPLLGLALASDLEELA
jgi:hypothetical protein